MFERFSDSSRRCVVAAQEECRNLGHFEIDTEHLLLGLADAGECLATEALASLGLTLERLREQVRSQLPPGDERESTHIPFTVATKIALEQSLVESAQAQSNSIGTDHLLLALLDAENGARQALSALGVEAPAVRDAVESAREQGLSDS